MVAHGDVGLIMLVWSAWGCTVGLCCRAMLRLLYAYPPDAIKRSALLGIGVGVPGLGLGVLGWIENGTLNTPLALLLAPFLISLIVLWTTRLPWVRKRWRRPCTREGGRPRGLRK